MARGYFRCLRHLPRAEIAEAELLKQAFVMKFLDGRQRRFDRRGAVRRHQIEDLDLIGLQARQGPLALKARAFFVGKRCWEST